jgi:hypothetical protein
MATSSDLPSVGTDMAITSWMRIGKVKEEGMKVRMGEKLL